MGDEVVRVGEQSMLGFVGEISEVWASLACDGVDVVRVGETVGIWNVGENVALGKSIRWSDVVREHGDWSVVHSRRICERTSDVIDSRKVVVIERWLSLGYCRSSCVSKHYRRQSRWSTNFVSEVAVNLEIIAKRRRTVAS